MRNTLLAYSLVFVVAGCTTDPGKGTIPPSPVTFRVTNDGATALYVHADCNLGWTFTELANPSEPIGLPVGCGVCDCRALGCPPVVCGPCYSGGIEWPGGATQTWSWTPLDMSYEPSGGTTCSHTRVLPPGEYRVDLPVYAGMEDATAQRNGRVVTRTFTIPTAAAVDLPLAAGP